jgi:hypothetical protein
MDLLHLLDRSARHRGVQGRRARLPRAPARAARRDRAARASREGRARPHPAPRLGARARGGPRARGRVSGCSDFRGTLTVEAEGATRTFVFAWCCQWRADREGWRDAFGFSDQIRAAREFDWRCFERWREVSAEGALHG